MPTLREYVEPVYNNSQKTQEPDAFHCCTLQEKGAFYITTNSLVEKWKPLDTLGLLSQLPGANETIRIAKLL